MQMKSRKRRDGNNRPPRPVDLWDIALICLVIIMLFVAWPTLILCRINAIREQRLNQQR